MEEKGNYLDDLEQLNSKKEGHDKVEPQSKEQAKPSCEQELAEMTDLLKRTQANFENYRKQNEARNKELSKFASKEIIMQILPIVDTLALALKNTGNVGNTDFCQGVVLIYGQLNKLLEEHGVKEIDCAGTYNPYFHEALMKIDSELPENTILEVYQKGYTLHGQVVQHAKVKLSAGQKTTGQKKDEKK